VIVGTVGELEDVGRKWNLVLSHVLIACGVLLKDGVGIRGDIFVRVDSHKGRGSGASVDVVGHEALAEMG